MITHDQAREIGQMAMAGPTQVILTSGAVSIVNGSSPSSSTPAAAAASYTQPSEVVVRHKCRIFKEPASCYLAFEG
eukprot:3407295-Amphidinium_carterae.3